MITPYLTAALDIEIGPPVHFTGGQIRRKLTVTLPAGRHDVSPVIDRPVIATWVDELPLVRIEGAKLLTEDVIPDRLSAHLEGLESIYTALAMSQAPVAVNPVENADIRFGRPEAPNRFIGCLLGTPRRPALYSAVVDENGKRVVVRGVAEYALSEIGVYVDLLGNPIEAHRYLGDPDDPPTMQEIVVAMWQAYEDALDSAGKEPNLS